MRACVWRGCEGGGGRGGRRARLGGVVTALVRRQCGRRGGSDTTSVSLTYVCALAWKRDIFYALLQKNLCLPLLSLYTLYLLLQGMM